MFEKFVDIVFTLSLFGNALFFVPQIIRLLKSKNSKGVSLFTFLGFNFSQLFTALHAYFAQDYILMWGFLLSLLTSGTATILIASYRIHEINYKNRQDLKSMT